MCILLVEDEARIREFFREVLEVAGYEVISAEDGREAYKLFGTHPERFTCVVTDYHMPGDLTGGHVIERVRAACPLIPVILASAYPQATTPVWREQFGVHLLVKPYYPEDLINLISRLLR